MADDSRPALAYASPAGRWVLFTTVLGWALAFAPVAIRSEGVTGVTTTHPDRDVYHRGDDLGDS